MSSLNRSASRLASLTLLAVTLVAGCGEKRAAPTTSTKTTGSAAARPELQNLYQVAPTVDLLDRIDLDRDVFRGDFRFDGDALVFSGQQAQLNVPVEVPEQYEMMVKVARTEGDESLNLGLHVGGSTTSVVIEGWGRGVSGLNLVDGEFGLNNETRSEFPVFKDTSEVSIRIIVRRTAVMVDVNGGVFIDFRGDPSRLSFDQRYFQRPTANHLMIGCWNSSFRVSSWTLRPYGDQPVQYAQSEPPPRGRDLRSILGRARAAATGEQPSAVAPSASRESMPSDATDSVDDTARANKTAPTPQTAPLVDTQPEVDSNAEASTSSVAWRARPDPSPLLSSMEEPKLVRVEMERGAALIPLGRSPYFCVIRFDHDVRRFQRYDLRRGEAGGNELSLLSDTRHDYQLAESGEYLLSYTGYGSDAQVEIHSFDSGEQVYSATSPDTSRWDDPGDRLIANQGLLSLRASDDALEVSLVDLQSGQITATWESGLTHRDLHTYVVTPGGHYVVLHWQRELHVFDIVSGELCGKIKLPEQIDELLGLAFTSDGTQLAALGTYDKKPSSLTWCIDWTTGQTTLIADTGFELDSLSNVYELGPALEWVPGDQLLLFFGRDLIDRQTGKFFYRIPENVYWQMPRRAVSPTTLLAMMRSKNPHLREYRTVTLERNAMRQSLQVVRRGGIAADFGLPPLTVAQADTGRKLSMSDNDIPLSVQIEPRGPLVDESIQLPQRLMRSNEIQNIIRRIQFADSDPGFAVAHIHFEGERRSESREMITRFDLRRGKPTGSVQVREDVRLIDFSPDGTLALLGLTNEAFAFSRIDVVDLTDQSHVAGWRPYFDQPFRENEDERGQPAPRDPQTASWVRFIDNDHVVTCNPEGRLVCWQIPACTAVYTCEDFGKPFVLSANRRYLAGSDGKSVYLLDVKSGQWSGRWEIEPTPQDVFRLAIKPDGSELVAVLGYQGRREIAFWSLREARETERFELRYSTVSPGWDAYSHTYHRRIGVKYKRDGYLLMDDLYLIDRQAKTIPWSYQLSGGRHVVGEVDDREWFVQQITGNDRGQYFDWLLDARLVPTDEVISEIANAGPPQEQSDIGRTTLKIDP